MSEQNVPLLAADGMMSPVSMPSPALSIVSQTISFFFFIVNTS